MKESEELEGEKINNRRGRKRSSDGEEGGSGENEEEKRGKKLKLTRAFDYITRSHSEQEIYESWSTKVR